MQLELTSMREFFLRIKEQKEKNSCFSKWSCFSAKLLQKTVLFIWEVWQFFFLCWKLTQVHFTFFFWKVTQSICRILFAFFAFLYILVVFISSFLVSSSAMYFWYWFFFDFFHPVLSHNVKTSHLLHLTPWYWRHLHQVDFVINFLWLQFLY